MSKFRCFQPCPCSSLSICWAWGLCLVPLQLHSLARQLPKNSCPWDSGGYLILELLFPALGLLRSSRSPKEGKEEELREHSLRRDTEQVLPLRSDTGSGTLTPRRWHLGAGAAFAGMELVIGASQCQECLAWSPMAVGPAGWHCQGCGAGLGASPGVSSQCQALLLHPGSACSAGICSCLCELPWGQQCPLSPWVLQVGWQERSQPDCMPGNGIHRVVPAEGQGHTQSCAQVAFGDTAVPWLLRGALRGGDTQGPPNSSSPCTESQPTTSDETVVAGGTVVLKCQVEDPDDSSLQWSNPAQQTLYFGEKRGKTPQLELRARQLRDGATRGQQGAASEGDVPSCCHRGQSQRRGWWH